MAASDHPPLTARRVAVGMALTLVGGFVDAFSYITLSNVYTATMSGNTVLIAVHSGESARALLYAYTVGVFLLGLLVSAVAIELGLRRGLRRVLAVTLAIEAACLAVFALWGAPLVALGAEGTAQDPRWSLYALLALAATAMGVQNTSLRMAGILTIFTTHVTGTLTRLGEQLVSFGFALADRRPEARARLAQAGFSAGLWLAFLGGALLASKLLPAWGIGAALSLPIAVLLSVVAADLLRPFAEPRRERG